ncbi:ribokinase [Halalkalibaculum sp. DA3122]|uniref:ribokinase n=1 Tax=Halalkalibaculum sp. DA3122 TaxID=3373607 RepID=UPI0037541A2D
MSEKILIVGSANIDMVVRSERFPEAGETILGGEFQMHKGGKGANQAVAAAKLGGNVSFICKLGNDEFGDLCTEQYKDVGINVDNILFDEDRPTGVAMISVNMTGENKIVVAPGANHGITRNEIKNLKDVIVSFDLLVLQLEIPIEIVGLILEIAREGKTKVILNPAPALELPNYFFKDLFLVTPNQNEAEKLTGIHIADSESLRSSAKSLQELGVKNVVITLGSDGVFMKTEESEGIIPAQEVIVEDTTAAGDVFNGALSTAIIQGQSLRNAIKFANMAAALSVSRNGAQSSIPTIDELQGFISDKS